MVAPLVIAGAVTGGLGLLAKLFGDAKAAGDEARAQAIREQIAKQYGEVPLPELERLSAEQLGPSAFEGMSEDMGPIQSQMAALRALDAEGQEGGSAASRAQRELARADAEQMATAQRMTDQQRLQQRGMQSSALAAALDQQAGQAAANRGYMGGLQGAVDANRQRMAALEAAGGLAGNIRGANYRASSDKASAIDSVNRYNANMRSDASRYNAGLGQKSFDNRMGLLGAQSNARLGQASGYQRSAEQSRDSGDRWLQAGITTGAGLAERGWGDSERYEDGSPIPYNRRKLNYGMGDK